MPRNTFDCKFKNYLLQMPCNGIIGNPVLEMSGDMKQKLYSIELFKWFETYESCHCIFLSLKRFGKVIKLIIIIKYNV